MRNQNDIFYGGEANAWYTRNKSILSEASVSIEKLPFEISELCKQLMPFRNEIGYVLEIGSSNGIKLEAICNILDSRGEGLDPSNVAVADGNARLAKSQIKLTCGTADKLPFESGIFDLVYFGFCAYLFDRTKLLSALAEADRVLKTGGFLAITDFDPGSNCKRPYIHNPGIYSYKQDYSKTFIESGLYYLVSKASFSHQNLFFDKQFDERVSLTLMYKELDPYPLSTSQCR